MQLDHKIEVNTTLHAPLEKVWNALTNPEVVKKYFFGSELITTWEVGSAIVFQGEWEGQKYMDKGKVLEYVKNEKLTYSYLSNWSGKEDAPENYLLVGYMVKPVTNGTELTIVQTNYDAERAEHSKGNWASLLDSLKKILE